ncbi:MAG: ATP phosphoribosyltransferase regulatory subunit [Bacillota bacterium]
MTQYSRQTPEGVQDYLPVECYNKTRIEKKMAECFHLSGYDQVDLPVFEYMDVFATGVGSVRVEKMIKFIDNQGRILVLRPDLTVPIARMSSTRMKDAKAPLRLFYVANAFGTKDTSPNAQKEYTQAGVELLGVPGPEGDAEVIALAIETLLAAGLEGFAIDIGQVEFFKGLMEEAGLTGEQSRELREYVDQKNMLAIELFLNENKINSKVKERIMRLPALYGKEEVLDNAMALTQSERALSALATLRQVYEYLKAFGLAGYVTFDLGMLYSTDYYTGLIFRGITDYLGAPILSGGRYDTLTGDFGCSREATGFAIGVKRVLIALERQGCMEPLPRIDAVISAVPEKLGEAYAYANTLKENGSRVVVAWELDARQLEAYAREIYAQAIYFD